MCAHKGARPLVAALLIIQTSPPARLAFSEFAHPLAYQQLTAEPCHPQQDHTLARPATILRGRKPAVGIIDALNMTVPGYYAHLSSLKGGEPQKIPQYAL